MTAAYTAQPVQRGVDTSGLAGVVPEHRSSEWGRETHAVTDYLEV